jgi:hypothetical protein
VPGGLRCTITVWGIRTVTLGAPARTPCSSTAAAARGRVPPLTINRQHAATRTGRYGAWYVLLNRNSCEALDVDNGPPPTGRRSNSGRAPTAPTAMAVHRLRRGLLPAEVENSGKILDIDNWSHRRRRQGPTMDRPQRIASNSGWSTPTAAGAVQQEQQQGTRRIRPIDRQRRHRQQYSDWNGTSNNGNSSAWGKPRDRSTAGRGRR